MTDNKYKLNCEYYNIILDDDLKKSKHGGVILSVFKCFYVEFI